MALRISNALAILACNAFVDALDSGASAASLEVFSGAQPANPQIDVTTQTLLVRFDLPEPAFGEAVSVSGGARAEAAPVDPVLALASGTATWFRAYDGDGNATLDGSVSESDGDGELLVASANIVAGTEVSIISFTFTQPKGY